MNLVVIGAGTEDGDVVMFDNGASDTGKKIKGDLVVGAGDTLVTGACVGITDTGKRIVKGDGVANSGGAVVCGGDVLVVGTGRLLVVVACTVGRVVSSGILENGEDNGEAVGNKISAGAVVSGEATTSVGELVSGKESTNGEPDGDAFDIGRLGSLVSGRGGIVTDTTAEGVLVDGDGFDTVKEGMTVSGSPICGDSDTGRALLPGRGKGAAVIIEVGSTMGASCEGLKVGFVDLTVGDVPGSTMIEPLLGPSDISLLFGASDGDRATKFVGFDVAAGNGSVSTVTVVTTLPVVSYVVLSTCPQLFCGSLNIEQNGTAISTDTTHCIRSSNVPCLQSLSIV